jgi:carbon storage regulator
MLVLTRRDGEEILIGNEVTIVVVKIGSGKVRIGVTAPKEVPVHRAEIASKISNRALPQSILERTHD